MAPEGWGHLRTAIGPATFGPDAIDRLLSARTESEATGAYWELDNRVVVQGQLYEAAERATASILGLLTAGDYTQPGLGRALDLLVEIARGEPDPTEVAAGNVDLGERCRSAIAAALSQLRTLAHVDSPGAAAAIRDLVEELGCRGKRVNILVRTLQSAVTAAEARPAATRLEADYFPHQFLRSGCGELAKALFDGLPTATAIGASESWDLLGQIAAGTARGSSEDSEEITALRRTFVDHAELAISRLQDPDPRPYDFLVLDVVDSMLLFADPGLQSRSLQALESFEDRGSKEAQAAEVVLRDYRRR